MKSLSCLVLLLIVNLSLAAQMADSLKYISLEPYDFHLQYLKTDSSILIDVREPFEFRGNRIKGAVNYPASGNLDKVADTLNKETQLFIYCTTGFRSSNAAVKLYDKGFRKLYNLEGGIVAWRKEGMPVIKGKGRRAGSREQRAGSGEQGEGNDSVKLREKLRVTPWLKILI